mgnify:CR=1 FL=1
MFCFFFMIRRPPRFTQSRSSAASDVYKRQVQGQIADFVDIQPCKHQRRSLEQHHQLADRVKLNAGEVLQIAGLLGLLDGVAQLLSLIHISEPTRLMSISYAAFCLKKKQYSKNSTCPHNCQVYKTHNHTPLLTNNTQL